MKPLNYILIAIAALNLCGWALAQHGHGKGDGKDPVVKVVSSVDIDEEVSGKKAKATTFEITFGPGAAGSPHRHPGAVFGYVVEGEFEFAIADEKVKKLKAGDTFYEAAMVQHRISRNPSDKTTTKVIAVMVHPRDAKALVIPEPEKKDK